jgi:Amt family ammonium transporter
LFGGGSDQLVAQIKGSAVITIATLAVGFALMYFVKLTRTLRISEEGELEGIDIHEHGAPAYHMEFGMGTSYITTGGSSGPPVAASGAKEKVET